MAGSGGQWLLATQHVSSYGSARAGALCTSPAIQLATSSTIKPSKGLGFGVAMFPKRKELREELQRIGARVIDL